MNQIQTLIFKSKQKVVNFVDICNCLTVWGEESSWGVIYIVNGTIINTKV